MKWNKRFEYPRSMRSMIGGKRHYDIDAGNKKLPSVTTILGQTQSKEKQESLSRWRDRVGINEATRITDTAAARGTAMHNILEAYVNGTKRIDLTPLGATDLVGVYDGIESIIDFKQSNKPKRREWIEDYFMQLGAYAMAHNFVYGTNITQGVNLICTKDNLFQEFIVQGREFVDYQHKWLARVDQYYKMRQE